MKIINYNDKYIMIKCNCGCTIKHLSFKYRVYCSCGNTEKLKNLRKPQ